MHGKIKSKRKDRDWVRINKRWYRRSDRKRWPDSVKNRYVKN